MEGRRLGKAEASGSIPERGSAPVSSNGRAPGFQPGYVGPSPTTGLWRDGQMESHGPAKPGIPVRSWVAP